MAEAEQLFRAHRWRLIVRAALTVALLPSLIWLVPAALDMTGAPRTGMALLAGWLGVFVAFVVLTWRVWRCAGCGASLPPGRADWWLTTCARCGARLRRGSS